MAGTRVPARPSWRSNESVAGGGDVRPGAPASATGGAMTNDGGFTLIEAVIVIVILGVIAVMGFSFVVSSADTYQMVTAEGRVATEVYSAMNRLTRELQFSDVLNVTTPAQTVDGTSAASSSLAFTTITSNFPTGWNAAVNCGNCVDNSTSITYSLNGSNQIIRNTAANNTQILADGITTFNVTMTRASRAAVVAPCPVTGVAGGLCAATAIGSNLVVLNAADTVTPGQALDLLLTVGAKTTHVTNYIPFTFTGVVNPTWTAVSAAGTAYTLSAKYLTITITKTDAISGVSVSLKQSVYPNSNLYYPVN
jgi:prepilin-type N-terminal cleavage/methylation domain-containing protein